MKEAEKLFQKWLDSKNLTRIEDRYYDVVNWGGVEPEERFYSEIKLKEAFTAGYDVNRWYYPSKGEDIYNADLDWSITYFLCQMKDGKLAIAFGSCDEGCEGNVSKNIDFYGENFDVLDTDDIYAWRYIIPPKEL